MLTPITGYEEVIRLIQGKDFANQLESLAASSVALTELECEAFERKHRVWKTLTTTATIIFILGIFLVAAATKSFPALISYLMVLSPMVFWIINRAHNYREMYLAISLHLKIMKEWKLVLGFLCERYFNTRQRTRDSSLTSLLKGEEAVFESLAGYLEKMAAQNIHDTGPFRGIIHSRIASLKKHNFSCSKPDVTDRLYGAIETWLTTIP